MKHPEEHRKWAEARKKEHEYMAVFYPGPVSGGVGLLSESFGPNMTGPPVVKQMVKPSMFCGAPQFGRGPLLSWPMIGEVAHWQKHDNTASVIKSEIAGWLDGQSGKIKGGLDLWITKDSLSRFSIWYCGRGQKHHGKEATARAAVVILHTMNLRNAAMSLCMGDRPVANTRPPLPGWFPKTGSPPLSSSSSCR